jgi:mannan endo-1,4-beta-mannosidase
MQIARPTSWIPSVAGARAMALTGLLALALTACAALPAQGAVAAQKGHGKSPRKPQSPPQPKYWGAWIGDQLTGTAPPWDMSAVSQFQGLVGKGLSLVEFSVPFADCQTPPCNFYDFPTTPMQNIRAYGAIPVLSWSSGGSVKGTRDPYFRFAKLLAGTYDPYIREFATAARNWGHPYFLRFNWEMNGDWFPWSEGVNGNKPGQFVAVWRHVHDIFTSVGATNASWVWCPYADPGGKFGRIGRLYPGGGYVDWTCMDGYNWAKNPTNPHPWRTFDEIFDATYHRLVRQIAPTKPVMLAELASTGRGKAKATWIRNMFRTIATRYRRVHGLIWFDQVDRGVDWPLETSPLAARAFAAGIGKAAFRGNDQASISTSPIPPPR